VGDTGLEHIEKTPGKQAIPSLGGAESGAVLTSGPSPLPSELTEIIAGWSRLPNAVRAGIVAMVKAVTAI
jgi:hypothetical protein